jgi:hypothetical protein
MGIISNKRITSELSTRQITEPLYQPITLDEFKLYARIDGVYEDDLLNSLIITATKQCEQFVRGSFASRNFTQSEDAGAFQGSGRPGGFNLFFGYNSQYAVEIKNTQVSAILEVRFYNTDNTVVIVDPARYRLDRSNSDQPARVVFNSTIDALINSRYFTQYEIDYTAGYANTGAVPQDIKTAIKMTALSIYESRENAEGGGLPRSAKNLLSFYRVMEL